MQATATKTDIGSARQYLKQTLDGTLASVAGLNDAQFQFKPAPDQWSIAETLEHMVMTLEFIHGPVWQQLLATPATEPGDYKFIDNLIPERFIDRSAKFKGPDPLMPPGNLKPAESIDRLRLGFAKLSHALETPDLRKHLIPSRPLTAITNGEHTMMDGHQWILATAAHTARHTLQIEEVKSSTNFPQ
jgi:hypothetical protein